MDKELLIKTAETLVAPKKGILAADSSVETMNKRLKAVGIEESAENRGKFREILITTEGIEEFLTGMIFFDETIRLKTNEGKTFAEVIQEKGILPGIKVDQKSWPMANFPSEKITDGIDGLRERLEEYKSMGVVFAKWRAVITIGDGIPTNQCIDSNMELLARYAAICQEKNIVPIVEPEVVMNGNHDAKRCEEVTYLTHKRLFTALTAHRVLLEATILKTNMILPGKESDQSLTDEEVAGLTFRVLEESVPDAIPGVVFLSGGQSAEDATRRLNEFAKRPQKPWELTFSYERALQEDALNAWLGKDENIEKAQKAFYERCQSVALARQGKLELD